MVADSFSSSITSVWTTIVSIIDAGVADVYDLEVYRHHNYLAHGVWNHNSGKTAIYYSAGAELLASGKCKRGLIVMPAKPRSQQEDYDEVQPDGTKVKKTGEKTKYLKQEMAGQFSVVAGAKDLEKKLQQVKDGTLKCLIVSPEMMRDHADTLKAAGFGGNDAFTFIDEAHEEAIGNRDVKGGKEGSGKAQAARALCQSSGYTALGSGTFIENDGSELYAALNAIAPDAFPTSGRKDFSERWSRQAIQGKTGVLSPEMLGSMNAEVGGYMLHHHQAPTGPDGKPVTLTPKKVTITLSDDAKQKIIAANEQRAKDETSEDENVRTAAALRWSSAVQRACIGPAMFDHIAGYVGDRRKKDPSYKAVVWSQELLPIDELKSRLGAHGKVVTITGANGDKETAKAIESFNKDPDVVAIVVSNAANFGVNLQAGHSVIKCGFPPVPSKDEQLDARIFRRGQNKDVETITYLGDHPLMQAAYDQVHSVKGADMAQLANMADDHLLGQVMAQYGPLPAGKAQDAALQPNEPDGPQGQPQGAAGAGIKKALGWAIAQRMEVAGG